MSTQRSRISAVILVFAAACALAAALPQAEEVPQAAPEARRVLDLIDRIEREAAEDPGSGLRRESISELELNAYIAYRIASENEEIMKELQLRLFPKSRIEGRVFIDLSGRKTPAGIKQKMTLLFSGTLLTRQGKVRLDIESFYLEGQKIEPAFLNFVISIVSRLEGAEPWKIEDWQALPFGIREMGTDAGRLHVEY